MQKQLNAELEALNRVAYLLGENSFQRLTMNDDEFAEFIEDLYQKVCNKMTHLKTVKT